MLNKITLYVVFIVTLILWPLSLIQNPPDIKFNTIFYHDTLETLTNNQKISLIYTPIKRPYYNKYSVYRDRYFENFLYLLDLNNYFFSAHPREDISTVNYRPKFPYLSLVVIILAIPLIIKHHSKWHLPTIIYASIGLLIIPFFKNTDGLDLYFYPLFGTLFFIGYKKISQLPYGFLINTAILAIALTEILRVYEKI